MPAAMAATRLFHAMRRHFRHYAIAASAMITLITKIILFDMLPVTPASQDIAYYAMIMLLRHFHDMPRHALRRDDAARCTCCLCHARACARVTRVNTMLLVYLLCADCYAQRRA